MVNSINGKVVSIIANGPSAKYLETEIYNYVDLGILWGALNRYSPLEKGVMSKINKTFDIVYCSSSTRFQEEIENISTFLSFPGKLFITTYKCFYEGVTCIDNVDITADLFLAEFGLGFSSLCAFLYSLMNLGAKAIFLFGVDGVVKDVSDAYYGQEYYVGEEFDVRRHTIGEDTKIMNSYFWEFSKYWCIPKCPIINCNVSSSVTCFEKVNPEFIIPKMKSFL